MINFTGSEVLSAYKKLKHYFYYDSTSLFVRQRISEFEEKLKEEINGNTFEEKLKTCFDRIAKDISSKSLTKWEAHFDRYIDIRLSVKSIEKPNASILTNTNNYSSINLERSNYFVDTSVETHIISVLWLMHAGKYLAKSVDKDCYAYKLELSVNESDDEDEEVVNGLKLYQPYFREYQNWRDNAISKVQQLFNEKKDSVLIGLDIKNYYHNAVISLTKIKDDLYNSNRDLKELDNSRIEKLFSLLSLIHKVYSKKILQYQKIPHLNKGESVLPIGLLSSGLLSNLVLKEFDKKVKELLNPSYYGRYVDDILFVLTNVNVEENTLSPVNTFLSKYFIERNILEFVSIPKEFNVGKKNKELRYGEPNISQLSEEDYLHKTLTSNQVKFKLVTNPTLEIQSKKVILQNFNSSESPAIINKFKKNIDKNRSEFRFLPEEDKIEAEFEDEAFSIHYNDSINKIRSIKEFSEDKYGASKYLAGKIFVASYTNEKPSPNTVNQILTFFKGRQALNFFTLWEKVATYLIITEQKEACIKFINQCEKSINAIKKSKKYEEGLSKRINIVNKIKSDMQDYLYISIATPLALNPTFLSKKDLNAIKYPKIYLKAINLRKANLLRHQILETPVINYTNLLFYANSTLNLLKSYEEVKKNYINNDNGAGAHEDTLFDFSDQLVLLSPRYVHYHELTIYESFKTVNLIKENDQEVVKRIENLNEESFKDYWRINHKWKTIYKMNYDFSQEIADKKKTYFLDQKNSEDCFDCANYITIAGNDSVKKIDKKVALANVKINSADIKNSYLGKPNTSKSRRELFFKLLNLVEQTHANILILPEVSIPYKWMSLLATQSHKRDIAIIAGLEHWTNAKKIAFNFIAAFLPIKKSKFRTCFTRIRLKNHYSPEEIKSLKGYRLLIPSEVHGKKENKYDLFHWQGVYFSIYNCYELADINDRSIFKAKVDFIVASEYNRDTNYFSEIAGSWVRDIHCFFIQVNTSDYGDSRLIQPSKTDTRDVIRIKGGENSTILVGEMPITELRDFQLKEYELQKDDARFKPTPPDFNRKLVEIRINNQNFV